LQPEFLRGWDMKELNAFWVRFSGLKEGHHQYTYEIGPAFFKCFEYSEIQQGVISVQVDLEKQSRMMIFNFSISGYVSAACDRCLADMQYPVRGRQQLILKTGREWIEETDEILIIPESETRINLGTFIYEYIVLMLPIKKVHTDLGEACNPEMLEQIENLPEKETDPRWDNLKELKIN
jgi:uncharacterized protein